MSTKEKVFQFLKSLIDKYGEAFPSFPTIAKVAGCSSRYATDMVKQLEEEGRIRKEHRFVEENGMKRQLSNRYEIIGQIATNREEEPLQEEALKKTEEQPSSPYIKAFKSPLKNSFIKPFTDDDINIHYRHREFFEVAQEWGLPSEIANEIFVHIKDILPKMRGWGALYWSLNRLKEFSNTISSIGPWFESTLRKRDLMLRMK